jgi:hypothetical protein
MLQPSPKPRPTAGSQNLVVLEAIEKADDAPTVAELAERTGLPEGNVNASVNDLRRKGHVAVTGAKQVPDRKSKQRTWAPAATTPEPEPIREAPHRHRWVCVECGAHYQ